jgi:nucleoside 2-deoxyribosyltransferase
MKKCYIASGWFNAAWEQEVDDIKEVLDNLGLSYYSPKDENLCGPNATPEEQESAFKENIDNLHHCDWLLCNTRNKDMGTIFEAGYYHSLGKPIVYFCAGLPANAPFNLMLSRSGLTVITSIEALGTYLRDCKESGGLLERRYSGIIE